MNASLLKGSSITGFATDASELKPAKKTSWSLYPDCRLITRRRLAGECIVGRSHFYTELGRLSVTANIVSERRNLVAARSHACSNCGAEAYHEEENSTSNEVSLFGSLKEALYELVGIPITGPRARSVVSDLTVLALPAIVGQAIEPLAQLMETAYVGRLGPVELASAGVSVSIFNIISKLFNIPLLGVTTSFVAKDIARNANTDTNSDSSSNQETKDIKIPVDIEKRMQLPSVASALVLATGIGIIEAVALYFGAGSFLNLMGLPSVCKRCKLSALHTF